MKKIKKSTALYILESCFENLALSALQSLMPGRQGEPRHSVVAARMVTRVR